MNDPRPSIVFRLDARSDRAPFRQLVDQVTSAFERGQLQPGDQLPSVRDVVTQITINPNTVHRAYRELEHLGIAEGRAGLGTFITSHPSAAISASEPGSIERELKDRIIEARDSGMSEEQISELIALAYRQDRDLRT